MQTGLFVTYFSGAFPFLGYIVMIPLGMICYGYISVIALWSMTEMFDGKGTFFDWLIGPFRRAVMG